MAWGEAPDAVVEPLHEVGVLDVEGGARLRGLRKHLRQVRLQVRGGQFYYLVFKY